MLFLAYSNETTAEADLYYINGTPGTLNVMKTALYAATTLVSDAFMVRENSRNLRPYYSD
jgi:hypothetical protein